MQFFITPDTTTLSYWLNWRIMLRVMLVLTPVVVAIFIIWKYEGLDKFRSCRRKTEQDAAHSLYINEAWRPCLPHIHPIWLFAYRLISFTVLLVLTFVKISISGFSAFYFYTQWTFTFLTIYFGFGSLFSLYGCYLCQIVGRRKFAECHIESNSEQGYYIPLNYVEGYTNSEEKFYENKVANICCHLFQIIFQMIGGAVMFIDCLYWCIIFPYFSIKDYPLNFVTVNMHTVNAVLLLGDVALNCLPFPWFRISYFILWTGVYVLFQWIFHAFVPIWWPYPFLDLSSPYAPLWYLLMALLHLPCYGIFLLIVKLKHHMLSKWFPSYYHSST